MQTENKTQNYNIYFWIKIESQRYVFQVNRQIESQRGPQSPTSSTLDTRLIEIGFTVTQRKIQS
jgi:hypothetical protein